MNMNTEKQENFYESIRVSNDFVKKIASTLFRFANLKAI